MGTLEKSIHDKIERLEESIKELSIQEYNNNDKILNYEQLILKYYTLLCYDQVTI